MSNKKRKLTDSEKLDIKMELFLASGSLGASFVAFTQILQIQQPTRLLIIAASFLALCMPIFVVILYNRYFESNKEATEMTNRQEHVQQVLLVCALVMFSVAICLTLFNISAISGISFLLSIAIMLVLSIYGALY